MYWRNRVGFLHKPLSPKFPRRSCRGCTSSDESRRQIVVYLPVYAAGLAISPCGAGARVLKWQVTVFRLSCHLPFVIYSCQLTICQLFCLYVCPSFTSTWQLRTYVCLSFLLRVSHFWLNSIGLKILHDWLDAWLISRKLVYHYLQQEKWLVMFYKRL